jgi:hypothetical protein
MDANETPHVKKWLIEDSISALWVMFFFGHIGLVSMFRFTMVDGKFLITAEQLPIACFQLLNAFLAPLLSIMIFYVLNKRIQGIKTSSKISWGTLVLTILSNIYFTAYILTPLFLTVPDGIDLLAIYSEATMMVGLVNVAVLGPLTAIVYSAD